MEEVVDAAEEEEVATITIKATLEEEEDIKEEEEEEVEDNIVVDRLQRHDSSPVENLPQRVRASIKIRATFRMW